MEPRWSTTNPPHSVSRFLDRCIPATKRRGIRNRGFTANVDELITPPLPVHLRQRRDPEQGYYAAVPECPVPW